MKAYHKVLLALSADPKSDAGIIKRVQEIVKEYDADLTLIHAVEHLSSYGAAYGVSAGVDIEGVLQEEAQKSLDAIGKKLKVAAKKRIIKIGPAKQAILEEAERIKADLIVLGSHGRHGVRLLLGSTANAVLHGAECDVLAVRIQD